MTGVFLPLLPSLPPALRRSLSSLFPPSLSSGLRVSLGCHVTASAWSGGGGVRGGGDYSLQGRKFLGFFFLPPFSTIWPQFLRHQRPLGGPADFPLVNSHRQEEARLLLVLYGFWFLFVCFLISETRFSFCVPSCLQKADERYSEIGSRLC